MRFRESAVFFAENFGWKKMRHAFCRKKRKGASVERLSFRLGGFISGGVGAGSYEGRLLPAARNSSVLRGFTQRGEED